MVRASAKNHANVAIVVSPDRLRRDHRAPSRRAARPSRSARRWPARRSGTRPSYDVAVASYIGSVVAPDQPADESPFPAWVGGTWTKHADLRYGENSHQKAALYSSMGGRPGIAQAVQLHGKEMSYNNYVDADAAVRAAFDFDEPAVAIIKHANPCGIAIARPGHPTPSPTRTPRARVRPGLGVRRRDRREPHRHPRDGRDGLGRSSPRCSSRPRSRPRPSSCSRRRRTSACSRCPRASRPTAVELRQVSGGALLQQADRHFSAGVRVDARRRRPGRRGDPRRPRVRVDARAAP